MEKFEKIMRVVNKYSLLLGGFTSLYCATLSRNSTWEMVAWACSSMFAFSGFAQIVEVEKKLKEKDSE
jgi:hypothetical protein